MEHANSCILFPRVVILSSITYGVRLLAQPCLLLFGATMCWRNHVWRNHGAWCRSVTGRSGAGRSPAGPAGPAGRSGRSDRHRPVRCRPVPVGHRPAADRSPAHGAWRNHGAWCNHGATMAQPWRYHVWRNHVLSNTCLLLMKF